MTKKGLILAEYYPLANFTGCLLDIFREHLHFLNTSTDINTIKKYIDENNIKYMIIGYSNNSVDYSTLDIPILLEIGDIPRRLTSNEFKDYCIKNKVKGIINHCMCTQDPIKDYFSPYQIDTFFFRRGLNLDIMKDYGLEKDIDVLSNGKFSNYQFRRELHSIFSIYRQVNYQRFRITSGESPDSIYTLYGKTMNKSWFTIGGCQQEKEICYYKGKFISDSFPKNQEIIACKSCLLTTTWGDQEYLGFKDGENCVLFKTPREALRKVLYYLDNKEELINIIDNGYRIAQKYYNSKINTKKLIEDIEKKYGL